MNLPLKVLYLSIICFIVACNNANNNIPLPDDTTAQPVTTPLHFSPERKIKFSDTESIRVTTRNLNFNTLPEEVFDSSAFKPFTKAPTVTHFNWDSLPQTSFNYENLPSKPLKFETSILDAPKIIHTNVPVSKQNNDIIYDLNAGGTFAEKIISGIMQDHEGLMWIIGAAGLYRYDGTNLMMYTNKNFSFEYWSLLEDKKGKIWFASANEGVFVLDLKKSIIKHFLPQSTWTNGFEKMLCDNNNRIWFCTDSGINIIDEHEQKVKILNKKQGVSGNGFWSIYQDKESNIWLGTGRQKIDILNERKRTIKHLRLDLQYSSEINEDSSQNIWLGGPNRVNIINKCKGTITCLKDSDIFKYKAVPEFTNSILNDKNGLAYISTCGFDNRGIANGLAVINFKNNTQKIINTNNGLNANSILTLLQDKYNQIWVGSENGINVLNRKGINIEHTGNTDVSSLAQDANKNILLGTLYNGLQILNPINNRIRIINHKNGLCNDTAGDIRIQNGKIYITTQSGLNIIDTSYKTIQKITNNKQLNNNSTFTVLEDIKRKVLVTGNFKGIEVIDVAKQASYNVDVSPNPNDTMVYEIKQDYKGNIWFVTRLNKIGVISKDYSFVKYIDAGIIQGQYYNAQLCFDEQNNTWLSEGNTVYKINAIQDSLTLFNQKNGLFNSDIFALNESKDRVFVSTLSGINVINIPSLSSQKWLIHSFGKNDGFNKRALSQRSNTATNDGAFLWGDRGITILKEVPSSNTKIPQTIITGIDFFNQPQFFSNKAGKYVVKEDTLWNTDKSKYYLKGQSINTAFDANQNKMKWDSTTGVYKMPSKLILPYDENNIQFHFVQADLGMQDTIWYRYILEDRDKQWSEKSSNTISNTYFNLTDGKYTFKVSSLYNDVWSKPVEFSFTINTPWWKTLWAYILYAFIIVMMYTTIRSLNLKSQNKLLEVKVNQRTEQLNKSIEDLKSTQAQLIQSEKMASLGELTAGIAHEIQNPLNFVNNFSEVNKEMIDELQTELKAGNVDEVVNISNDIKANEEKINYHGKRADAIVKGMLQHSKQTKGTKELTDINALCDEYLRLAYHGIRAKDKNFNADFTTDFDATIEKINVVPQDIARVLLNLFNNAFYAVNEKKKLMADSYQPLAEVKTQRINDKVEIIVSDNGNGIPQNIIDKIFQPFFTTKPTGEGTGLGLSLAYDIITKEHNGIIKVESKEGEGSTFTIQLPVT